ncbi:MAG TPA: acyl-CoA dehydrogenase family protein [Polyangiaceae bacterium]|nr:acyl-CoA dehydrogenase family protein [Polyangiaceae bacterium]
MPDEKSPPTAALSTAQEALARVRGLLERAVWSLRERSLENGQVAAARLDAAQLVSLDVALSFAELTAGEFAARYALRAGASGDASLETAFARLFAAEAVHAIRGRICARPVDHGLAPRDIAATFEHDSVRALVSDCLAADFAEALGARVLETGSTGVYLLDEEHEMMRGTFRKFAAAVVAPLAEEIHRHDLLIPEAILKPLAELGGFGLSIPQRYGGLQPDDRDDNLGMIVVTEELSRGSLGAAGSLITRPEILSKALLKGGTEEQKQRWLPRLASGEVLNAIAVTEPDYGSDVASLKLRARRVDGGWKLSGAKTWCTFNGKAHVMLILARTNPDPAAGHRGLSLFLAEKPSFDGHDFEYTQPGGGKVSGRAIATIGYRGMHSYETFFEDFFVPAENLLGGADGEGKGFYYTMAGFSGGRIQTAARAIGLMSAALERAIAYARERKVFGRPIGDYQLTRVKLARMATSVACCRQFTYGVGRLMDQGKGEMEASLVKLYACRAALQLCSDALQIHGGMGYAEETPVSRYFVDSRVLSIFEGAEETLALKVVARTLVDRAQRVEPIAG